jgi:Uncharacterized membrane protein
MKKLMLISTIVLVTIVIVAFLINFFVIFRTKKNIISEEQASQLEGVDCILILGAGIWGDRPSPILEDRLLQGIALYKQGVAPKIIMSGDHGKVDYDEVNVMKKFAIDNGVPSEDIFMDHAGFSSYDSVYRAKKIFGANKIVMVTQKYHLYRSLYIAKGLNVEAYGVASDPRQYTGQEYREIREIVARNKDFFKCIVKPNSTYLGDTISLNGSGDITND